MDQRYVAALVALIVVCISVLAYRGVVPSQWLITVIGAVIAWLIPSPVKPAQ